MTRLLSLLLLACSITVLSGCGLFDVFNKPTADTKVEVVVSPVKDEIVTALANAPKDDCITIYKIFSGISMYMEHSQLISTTPQVFGLLSKVEKDYGWAPDKYSALTDVIEKDLTASGYADPKKIDDVLRAKIVKDFKGYAEAVKAAAEAKTNK